ncbi:MAG: hypothetical protein ACI8W7_002611 [Gammaproteobacteria bacterium]|jgi:hypothetical protein
MCAVVQREGGVIATIDESCSALTPILAATPASPLIVTLAATLAAMAKQLRASTIAPLTRIHTVYVLCCG